MRKSFLTDHGRKHWRAILLSIVVLCSCSPLHGQTWKWSSDVIESLGGEASSLALDQDGNLHATYRVAEGGQLRYAFRPAGSSKWFKMTLQQGVGGFSTNITVDADGNPYICYTPYALKYAHFNGHQWLTQEIDPGSGLVGFECSIRVSKDGRPMIVWYLPDGGFRYATLRDGVWLATGLDGNGGDYAGKWNSMSLDANDNPHIAYSDFPGEQLRYARYDGKAWIRSVLDLPDKGPGGPRGMGASIVLDRDDNPWISYYDEQSLRVAHYTNGKWEKQTVEQLPPFGVNWGWREFRSDIVLDHNGNPHIVFESHQGLEHAWWDGTQWRNQRILAPSSIVSYFDNSMVIDKKDVLYVTYKDASDGALKLATGRLTGTAQATSAIEKAP
jgi:hypothetical protein